VAGASGPRRAIQYSRYGREKPFYGSIGDVFHHAELLKGMATWHVVRTEVLSRRPIQPSPAWLQSPSIRPDTHGSGNGLRVHLEMQEETVSGPIRKAGPPLLGRIGFKLGRAMEHYRLTGDSAYLAAVYPRMARVREWQESKRRETRASENRRCAA